MRSSYFLLCCTLLIACSLAGCSGGPQFSPANRKVLRALQTAVTSKNTTWLDAVISQLDQKRSSKTISETECMAIESIVKTAKSGDWKRAQKEVIALIDAQRATSEDLAMSKERKNANPTSPN